MFNNELKSYNHANELFKTNQNVFTHVILNYEEPGMHGHDYIEFFYVIEGRCQHLLNGTSKLISSGDLFLLTTTCTTLKKLTTITYTAILLLPLISSEKFAIAIRKAYTIKSYKTDL